MSARFRFKEEAPRDLLLGVDVAVYRPVSISVVVVTETTVPELEALLSGAAVTVVPGALQSEEAS